MPKLETTLHLDMLRKGKRTRSLRNRIKEAMNVLVGADNVYGLEWGDPETVPPLKYVRDHFLLPYVTRDTTLIEIGPGGGRWTRYLLSARKVYAVDYHQELLDELRKNFPKTDHMAYIKNGGDDFPGVPAGSVDFVFSFGAFVHLDVEIIDRYLQNLRPLLASHANVVIQYSDQTKPMARRNPGFAENDPEKMRKLVTSRGYAILEEDVQTLWHSSIIRFGLWDGSERG
jgi:hypothetical protein